MKKRVALFLFLFSCLVAFATHQKAAEISFKHITGYTYQIQLTTYTYTESLTDRPELYLQWGDNTGELLRRVDKETILYEAEKTKENHYYGTHTYSGPGHYYISMEDADRNGGVINMPSSVSTPMFVQTLLVISPFIDPPNNSPILLNKPLDKACLNALFVHNTGAYDPDGDSLSYKLTICKGSGGEEIVGFHQPHSSKTFYIDSVSGNLTWDAPIEQGEFNVAMLIEEWREGFKISEITRDMQISVQACDNRPPKEIVNNNYCVEANQTLSFDVLASDEDSTDYLILTASGSVFELEPNEAAQYTSKREQAKAKGHFRWRPPYSAARTQAYSVYFKATDNGTPNLSDIQTSFIHVIAPAVQFDTLFSNDKANYLRWTQSLCPQTFGYQIYRKQGPSKGPSSDPCEVGVNDSAYSLIYTCQNKIDTSFWDHLNLVDGMQYCYKIVVLLKDGALGYASEEMCSTLQSTNPILTHVSVEETHPSNGSIWLKWKDSENIDSNLLKQCVYEVYRRNAKEEMQKIANLPSTQHSYTDIHVNTAKKAYFYKLALHLAEDSLHLLSPIGTSIEASSVFLQAIGKNRKIDLSWVYQTPWFNRNFIIYRYNRIAQTFDSIASTQNTSYCDTNLENDTTYQYVVLAKGTYFSATISEIPLDNWSNICSAIPRIAPPCVPSLRISSSECQPFQNELVWTFDTNTDCYENISHYILYYKLHQNTDFEILTQETQNTFLHVSPPSYFGCYAVSAVNISGQESELSATICADNSSCFNYKLPNVFTPNGDGINDYFEAFPNQYVEKFRITVFDSWGLIAFTSTESNFKWDGKSKLNGKECPTGTYFYIVEFSSLEKNHNFERSQTGVIMLLR